MSSMQDLGTQQNEFQSHITSLSSPRVAANPHPTTAPQPAWKVFPCLSFPAGGNLDWEQSAGKALPKGSGEEAANISLMPVEGTCTSPGALQERVPDVHRAPVVVAISQHIAAQATATNTHGAAKSHQEPPRARPNLVPPSLVGVRAVP